MSGSDDVIDRISRNLQRDSAIKRTLSASSQAAIIAKREARVIQANEMNLIHLAESNIYSPNDVYSKSTRLSKRFRSSEKLRESIFEKHAVKNINPSEMVDKIVLRYVRETPELNKASLIAFYESIEDQDNYEQILDKLYKSYHDKYLAHEALSFAIEVSKNKNEIHSALELAKDANLAQNNRDIIIGRNISHWVKEFSNKTLGSPTALRKLYKELTGTPTPPTVLFGELMEKFQFSGMKNILDFILHSLGSDLKAKGPSISKEELQRLCDETRDMQAILGIFRYFRSRMSLIKNFFARHGIVYHEEMDFELLSKQFVKLLEERYPTSDKILQLSEHIGISKELLAQVIIFMQYRDATRHVAPRLFLSERHRNDVMIALMIVIEELEDEMKKKKEEETRKKHKNHKHDDKPREEI